MEDARLKDSDSSSAPEIIVIGGGGHARVLLDALRASGETRSVGVLDSRADLRGTLVLDEPIIGDDAALPDLARSGAKQFVVAVGATRDNGPRARLFEHALSLGLAPLTIVHPNAVVSRWATLGAGCQVLAGAVVNANAQLGINVIVNTSAVIEHDCTIGDHVHIATGAVLASGVRVAALAHVGAGATLRQLISLGTASVVGAGAVVVKDVVASSVVVGVPAKELHTE